MSSLQTLLEKLLTNYNIRDTPDNSFKVIETSREEILLFIKEIKVSIETFRTIISQQTFGPDLIHQNDFIAIQKQLSARNKKPIQDDEEEEEEKVKKPINRCIYMVRSAETGLYYHECTLVYDRYFIDWLERGGR